MRTLIGVGGVLLLTIAACGGSDESDSSPAEEPAGSAAEESQDDTAGAADEEPAAVEAEETEAEEPEAPAAEGGSGPSTAVVTIEGTTYEFSTEGAVVAQCQTDMFGIFSVQLPAVGGDGSISIVALREGTDPAEVGEVNAVEFSAGDVDWVADSENMLWESYDTVQPGMSQVDSVEIDGSTVRGTATFVNEFSVFSGGEIETATGTFEATCGEERLT